MAATAQAEPRRIDFELNGPQSRAYEAIAERRTVTIPWGRGVGKSWFIRTVAFLLVSQWKNKLRTNAIRPFKGIRIVVLMPTLKQFKDVHGLALERENDEDWGFLGGKLDRTTWQIRFPDGSWIQPFPAELHNSKRSRGLRCDVVLTDETDDIDRDVFESVARPWFSEPWSLKIRICGGTPTRGRHGLLWHLHQLGLSAEATAERYLSFHATYRDAPETVDLEEVEDARSNSPEATFSREWECNFDAGEGLVYPFDEAFHVREPVDFRAFSEFIVGGDHGWVDPGVLLLGGVKGHGQDAELWILDEWYETECPNNVWDARARIWSTEYGATFYCDPSRPDRVADYRAQGCAMGAVDNEINGGIARVADLLFKRDSDERLPWSRLYVSPKCTNTIREFGLYRRKKLADGTFDEKPEDKHNHCLVAGTGVLTKRGEVPIERVVPGDEVATRAGWRSVQWSGQTFAGAPIWKLETTRGAIEGTPDHLVWTENRGWVRLDALRYGDTLTAWESTAERSGSDSTGKSSVGTPTLRTQTSLDTFGRAGGADEHTQSGSHLPLSAPSAPPRSKRSVDASLTGSALTPANLPGEGQAASTMSNAHASYVLPPSSETSTRRYALVRALVLGSSPAERSEPVYDLTVSGEHEFFANGVLVHNSMDALRYMAVGRFGKPPNYRHLSSGR